MGVLANHIWGVEHEDDAEAISSTFVQPFISCTYPDSMTVALNTETTYDWNAEETTVPVNWTVTKVIRLNGQAISVGGVLNIGLMILTAARKVGEHAWLHLLFSRNNQLSMY